MSGDSNVSVYGSLRAGLSAIADTGARYVMHQDSGIDTASLTAPARLMTFPRTAKTKNRLILLR